MRHPSLVITAIALGALFGACGAVPDGLPSAAGTPAEAPTPGPSVVASDGADPGSPAPSEAPSLITLPEGSIAVVVADELRVRASPGTDGEAIAGLLRGDPVRIIDGPEEMDAHRWYRVETLDGATGWAAAGDETDAWLTRSSTSSAGRLLEFEYGCDVTGPLRMPATTILEDGTVISTAPRGSTIEIAGLSADGIAAIHDDVLSLPALRVSADYTPVLRPDAGEAPGHGACLYRFTVGPDPDPIVVSSISWFGDEEEAAFYEPSPERRILDAIAQNLIAIRTVLHDSQWVDPRGLPYTAAEYTLWLLPQSPSAPDSPVPIQALGLGGAWDEIGEPHADGRCAVIPLDAAFEAVRQLRASGQGADLSAATFGVALDQGRAIGLILAPRTPLGRPSCEDRNL